MLQGIFYKFEKDNINKITEEFLLKEISQVVYTEIIKDKIIHCTIITYNGFSFTGEAAVVDPKNFVKEIGEKIAYENAFEKMWLPYGFMLQEFLYTHK